jgi:hypothetical protein
MTGQVSIRYLYQFFEIIKVAAVIHYECTHDAQPDTAVKNFI